MDFLTFAFLAFVVAPLVLLYISRPVFLQLLGMVKSGTKYAIDKSPFSRR